MPDVPHQVDVSRVAVRRRRQIYVNRPFQSRFIALFGGIAAAGLAVSGTVLYYLLRARIEDSLFRSHLDVTTTGQMLLPPLLAVNGAAVVLILLAGALAAVIISRRIFGPLATVADRVAGLTRGESGFVRGRPDVPDVFGTGLRREIDAVWTRLGRDKRTIEASLKELEALLDEMENRPGGRPGAAILADFRRARSSLSQVAEGYRY